MRKAPATAALRAQRRATLRRLSQLPDPGWDAPCLPGWRIRDVVAHLVAVDEASVKGRILPALRADGRDAFERWNDASITGWADRSPEELCDALERWGDRLFTLAHRMPSAAAQVPFRAWFGRLPLLFLVYRRVLDEWVHECDIAWASCPDGSREPASAEPGVPDVLAAAVLYPLPHLALPRMERATGVVRLVVETGNERRRTWGVDFARRQYGPRVTARPDAVVRVDAGTLALLAEGRWSLADLGQRLTVEGDDGAARDLLHALAPATRPERPAYP